MIPTTIIQKMGQQAGNVDRDSADEGKVNEALAAIGIEDHEQPKEFFTRFKLSGVLSNHPVELLDLCSPTDQIFEATDFGRDTYEMTDDFVCLTSGEGEGFLVYSKQNRKIYDVSVSDLDALEAGEKEASWDSFYDLVDWYLS